jgi:hypothetical protein
MNDEMNNKINVAVGQIARVLGKMFDGAVVVEISHYMRSLQFQVDGEPFRLFVVSDSDELCQALNDVDRWDASDSDEIDSWEFRDGVLTRRFPGEFYE